MGGGGHAQVSRVVRVDSWALSLNGLSLREGYSDMYRECVQLGYYPGTGGNREYRL